MRFFYENILQPYTQLFEAQRASALGQAKESAGNLTGSGYNNILGSATAESLAGQQALTAQTLMGLREQEIARQQNFLQMLMGFGTAGVGPPQTAYQPGLLDSILPAAGQIAGQYFGMNGFPWQQAMSSTQRAAQLPQIGYPQVTQGTIPQQQYFPIPPARSTLSGLPEKPRQFGNYGYGGSSR